MEAIQFVRRKYLSEMAWTRVADLSHFARVFRRIMDVTLTEFRVVL
jgi:hypothetical protein